jgi:hypothetical protein
MINTYNLQFGLVSLLGDIVNQLVMFIVLCAFVRPSKDACSVDLQDVECSSE